jgi:hypothetical protein
VLKEGFRYALPNIAVAALAKLGGIPWQVGNMVIFDNLSVLIFSVRELE